MTVPKYENDYIQRLLCQKINRTLSLAKQDDARCLWLCLLAYFVKDKVHPYVELK